MQSIVRLAVAVFVTVASSAVAHAASSPNAAVVVVDEGLAGAPAAHELQRMTVDAYLAPDGNTPSTVPRWL